MRLLAWRYNKLGLPLPPYAELAAGARDLVDEAHRIAGERGRNVLSIVRELVNDLKK